MSDFRHTDNASSNEVSVVIPAFNEELTIRSVLDELRELLARNDISGEIIVVDDGSKDATAKTALSAGARVIQHRSNRGYGAALKTGISAANYDVIAITDADDTYPVQELPALLAGLEHADMVVGARTGRAVHIPLLRRPAKWILNHLANYVSSTRIPDLNSGLRVFRRDVVMQYFLILPDQFSWTTTVSLAMHCDKYAVSYLPVDYRKRRGRSKIAPWDAGSFVILIMRMAMLFRPLRVFLPLAFVCLTYGVVKMTIDLSHDPNISASAVLAFLSALQLVIVGMLGDAIATRLGRVRPNAVLGVRREDTVELHSLEAQRTHTSEKE